ncbi:MAG: MoaD/ThiS family protein [Cyclobacteriaceae bacterium]|nr:MoaD/ThiS family protein [Cyclobacteriaceae bacterium]
MVINIKAFGICKDWLGGREITLDFEGATVQRLRSALIQRYPQMSQLPSLLIAVNREYADDQTTLKATDEVALIPPVSGG